MGRAGFSAIVKHDSRGCDFRALTMIFSTEGTQVETESNGALVSTAAATTSTVGGSRFALRRACGHGRSVRTFAGVDTEDGRDVMVKLLAIDSIHPATLMRAEYEATHLQRLASAWLAPTIHVGRENNDLVLVYRFVPGEILADLLKSRTLSLAETLTVGRALFSALRDIHRHGVLHRGIRPGNVVVSGDGSVTSAIMLPVEPTAALGLDDGEFQASSLQAALYLSPEQAGSLDNDMSEAADLYSAGVTLFHCLAGRPPFDGQALGAVLFAHMTTHAPALRSLGINVPRAIDEVLQRLLRKDPHDRYQTAAGVLADWEAIAAALHQGESEPSVVIGANDLRQSLTEPAFVARAHEVEALDEQIELAARGHASLVLLEGESGGGKTRVLTETAHRATARGFWVLWGHGTTDVAREPFSLLKGIVDGFVSAANVNSGLAEAVRERLGDYTQAVCAVLPGLSSVLRSGDAYSVPESTGEMRTLNALACFINALGTLEHPVLLVLDDCQWADELTYRLLRRWPARDETGNAQRHVLLVSAFRSEEVSDDHPLRRVGPDLHLRLSPFEPAEITQLVESMAGSLPEQAISVVVRLAEGSPFMASAVLRGLVETGELVREQDGWRVGALNFDEVQSSSRAADFLARRLELLPDETLQLLSTGAVLGKEFELDVAGELADYSPAQVITALDIARQRRLVWLRPDGTRCVFVHDKIRSSLLHLQPPSHRLQLHARAAEYLQRQGEPRAAEIAYHFDAALDPQSALPYALQAATKARSQYALEAAIQQYLIAERGAALADAKTRYQVAEALGEVLLLAGRYDQAGEKFEAAAELAEGTYAQAQIRNKLGELAFKRGDMEQSIECFEAALEMLGKKVARNNAFVYLLLGWESLVQTLHTWLPSWFVNRHRRQPDDGERLTLQLLSNQAHGYWYCRSPLHTLWAHLRNLNLAERYESTPELGLAYAEHAPAIALVGLHRRAKRYAEKSLVIRQTLNDLSGQAQALHYHGIVHYNGGEYQQSIKKCRDAIRLLERTGDYWQVHIARYQIAASLYHLGDLPGALEESQLNYKSGIELGDEQASGIILDVWVRAADGPIPQHILTKELERTRHDAQGRAQVLFANGLQLLRSGSPAGAANFIERAHEVSQKAGVRNAYTLSFLPWLATALRQQAMALRGQTPSIRKKLLRRAKRAARWALLTKFICPNDTPHALRELGILLAMHGSASRARHYLNKSLALSRRQSARLDYAQTLLARAEIGEELGWPTAKDDKVEAQAILGELHAYSTPQQLAGQKPASVSLSLVDRFDAVLDSGRRIASALSPPVIQAETRNAALRLLRAEHCIVLRVALRNGQPEFMPIAGSIPGAWNEDKINEALRTRRAVAFSENSPQRSAEAAANGGKRSALCAPLYARGEAVACLYATHEHVRDLFGNDDERLADYIVTIAGAALENAEGFAQLQALNETLERRVEERTAAVEARSQELALSNQQLERVAQELRQAQQQLTVAKQSAEAASEAKSRFLAAMSHEIRTPLNAVIGMTELTLKSTLTSPQRSNLAIAKDSAKTLLTLLNDLLDFSKIEAGRLELESISVAIRDVLGDVARLMAVTAARKGLELNYRVDPSVPELLLGDPTRLRQVLMNLVGNAIKFTDRGEIFITVESPQCRDLTSTLHFAVSDTGIGISRDKQDCIFEAFRQSDNSMTRRFGGTGLGLAISSQLVALMDGRIWVESELGAGSTFHFTATLQTIPQPVSEAGWKLSPPRNALLLSDNPRAEEIYLEPLQSFAVEAMLMRPGDPRVERLLRAGEESMRIDLVLMDVSAAKPEEAEWIQLVCGVAADPPPVVALLAAIDEGLPDRCRQLGADHCLTKPVRPKEWETTLRAIFAADDQPASPSAEQQPTPARPLRVLVVDDSPVNVEVAAGLLELAGHEIARAGGGREAVEMCSSERFDIVLMDLEMHDMDGLTATAAIRAYENPLDRHTPIIALTAHTVDGYQNRCLAAGMDGILSKPLNPDELFGLLAEYTPASPSVDDNRKFATH
ncbi:MAG: response regulator [Pirellulales bacterium]|nr:response regulator [Pirellulales bacterium]